MGRASFADARTIFSPGILLTYGVSMLAFDQTPANIPLVTGFCPCLLLSASSSALLAISAVLAIGSTFVLRFDGKHVFNPANPATVLMITDFKTTPDRHNARILFAVLVAAVAAWLQFARFMPQALMYALFFASPLVPLLNRLIRRDRPEVRFEWSRPVLN